jgi:hypothetical protein
LGEAAGLQFWRVVVVNDARQVALGNLDHVDGLDFSPAMAAGLAGDGQRTRRKAGFRHDVARGAVGAMDHHDVRLHILRLRLTRG